MSQDNEDMATLRLEAARALLAAGDQVALALSESQPEVEALGDALHLLAAALAEPRAGAPPHDPVLAAAMRQAISRLQFYDRMTQHLSHVQDYLNRSASHIADPEASHGWTGVHRELSDRLLSDTQRFHLGRNFPAGKFGDRGAGARGAATGWRAGGEGRATAEPGDIDLF
jgi:hypothetical protein